MRNAKIPYVGIGGTLEEAGKRLLFRVYEWGKNTAAEADKLEGELTVAMLSAFEESLKKLVRWDGGTITELTQSIRTKVENGIGVSRISAQAAYEKCVREIGRITVPKSVRDVADKLKIYADVAGIAGSRIRPETIVDAEFS